MTVYTVYVYTPDMFVQGLRPEASTGNVSGTVSNSAPLVLTLKANAVPIAVSISDTDGSSVVVNGTTWPTSETHFNEVSLHQHIVGGSFNPGQSINAAYTLTGKTATGAPVSVSTFRIGGTGPDSGPVQGLVSTVGLVPGQSYTFTSAFTTQPTPMPYSGIFSPPASPPCFTRGTMIDTARGAVPVETLLAGDLVLTRDHGMQPLRWIGTRRIGEKSLATHPDWRPIRIEPGALGPGIPASTLRLSPQHRILARSRIAGRMTGNWEVLVAVKHLVGLPGITVDETVRETDYVHLLFDRHEVLFANGAETESLLTGPEAMKSLGPDTCAEILALFPDLRLQDRALAPARQILTGKEGRKLAERHHLNDQPLFTPVPVLPDAPRHVG